MCVCVCVCVCVHDMYMCMCTAWVTVCPVTPALVGALPVHCMHTTGACVLVTSRRLRAAPALSFGNKHYAVTFDEAHASKRFPSSSPFGVRYRFSLQAERHRVTAQRQ